MKNYIVAALIFFIMSMPLISQNITPVNDDVIEYSTHSDTVAISTISRGMADTIYDYISNELDFIEFDDCNNCDSRAHLISAIVGKKFNVTLAKVWLFADFKRSSQTEKYRLKPHVYLSDNDDCTKWGFHVAPAVIIMNEGKKDTLVLDPSTSADDILVTVRQWALNLSQPSKGGKGFLIIKDAKYYTYPHDKNRKFEDEKHLWLDDQNKELLDADYSKSIEAILIARYGILEVHKTKDFEIRIHQLLK